MFTMTKPAAKIKTTLCTTGKSRLAIDVMSSRPMPGRMKICSMMTKQIAELDTTHSGHGCERVEEQVAPDERSARDTLAQRGAGEVEV